MGVDCPRLDGGDEGRADVGKVGANSDDIIYSNLFTGVHGNYLAPSIRNAGLDPANLPESDPSKMNFGGGENAAKKAWKDIWGCGQGIGAVDKVMTTADFVARLKGELAAARKRLGLVEADVAMA